MVKEIIVKNMRHYLRRAELRAVIAQCKKRLEEFRQEDIADASIWEDWEDSETLDEFLGKRKGDE